VTKGAGDVQRPTYNPAATMAKKALPPGRRPISRGEAAQLKRSLAAYAQRVEQLHRVIEINIRRMGALQAEIDHVRSMIRS
jgi:hypothetical protein